MRCPRLLVSILLLGALPARAEIGNLERFLQSVEETSTTNVALRADGSFVVVTPEATRDVATVWIVRPAADLYIELQSGTKALVPGATDDAYLLKSGANKADA